MRAVEFDGAKRARIVTRPAAQLGPGDLLLAPLLVGVCGTDVEIYDGSMAYYRSGQARYPIVPGHEWVAEVLAVGEEVEGFRAGDRVVGECTIGCRSCGECRQGRYHLCPNRTEVGVLNRDGAMATEMAYPAESAFLVPDGLSMPAAALVEPTAVALNAVRRGGVLGQSVLVVGGGAIGLLAAQAARAEGASAVTVGDTLPGRLRIAAELGLGGVELGVSAEADLAAIRERLGDLGADVVLVSAAAPAALALAIEAARPGGSIVVIALFGQEVPVAIDSLVVRDLKLQGVLGSPHCWPDAISLLASGAIGVDPLLAGTYPLSDVSAAIEAVGQTEGEGIKVMVEPQRTEGRDR